VAGVPDTIDSLLVLQLEAAVVVVVIVYRIVERAVVEAG